MTIPCVAPVVALSFVALIDDPGRFRRTTDVGAFLGLTPRRHQSGEMDWSGRASKCGDRAMRGLLVQAESWAMRLAARRGHSKATAATAPKIAVLMLTLWKTETDYNWNKEAIA